MAVLSISILVFLFFVSFELIRRHASPWSDSLLREERTPLFAITILTMNRMASLRRLLVSLEGSDYDGDSVKLVIKVDYSDSQDEVVDMATAFVFSHGLKTVEAAPTHMGLRGAWFEAWTPRDSIQHGIILEDDVEVSPRWYVWLRAAWAAYGGHTDIAGVSLQRQTFVAKEPHSWDAEIVNDHQPFLYLLVGSYGFSPNPIHWKRFITWVHSIDLATYDVSIPGLRTSDWWKSGRTGHNWTQYFIYYCNIHDVYNLYVNLPNNETLVAHHREKGEHQTTTLGRDFDLAVQVDLSFPKTLVKYGWDGKPS